MYDFYVIKNIQNLTLTLSKNESNQPPIKQILKKEIKMLKKINGKISWQREQSQEDL